MDSEYIAGASVFIWCDSVSINAQCKIQAFKISQRSLFLYFTPQNINPSCSIDQELDLCTNSLNSTSMIHYVIYHFYSTFKSRLFTICTYNGSLCFLNSFFISTDRFPVENHLQFTITTISTKTSSILHWFSFGLCPQLTHTLEPCTPSSSQKTI